MAIDQLSRPEAEQYRAEIREALLAVLDDHYENIYTLNRKAAENAGQPMAYEAGQYFRTLAEMFGRGEAALLVDNGEAHEWHVCRGANFPVTES